MNILLSVILLAAMQTTAPSPGSSPVEVVSRTAMSMVDEPKQVVVRDAAEWAKLWRQHAGNKPLPAVDFGSRTVVAVFLGTRSSAGFAVDVTAVRKTGGALVVEWQERRPDRDEVSAQVLTSPAIIATIPKFAGEITFEKVEQ